MSELPSSQILKDNTEVNDTREYWFADKKIMAAAFQEMGQGDITASDLPDFKEEVRFSSAEWVDLVRNIETRTKEDKKRILQEVISQKTQKRSQDLRSEVNSMEAEKKKIKDALTDLSPDRIESSLLLVETLLEYVPEQYRILLAGYAGSLILDTFEKHNQRIILGADNAVEVVPVDRSRITPELQQNTIDLALRMNALVRGGRMDTNILRTGMLYRAESFASYSANLRDANGHVLNPQDAQNPEKYLEYLQTKKDSGLSLSPEEETVMASDGSIRQYPLMIPAIEQFRDFGKVSHDAKIVANAIWEQIAPTETSKDSSWGKTSDNGASSAIGEWIGQIGGTIGKLAKAGAGGGIRVLNEVLTSAIKTWDGWGAAAVIGGLIYAIFKGGLWKTLGAFFSIGVISEASAGRVNLDLDGAQNKGKGESEKSNKPTEEKNANPRTVPSTETTQTDGKKKAKENIFKHEKLQALSVEKKELAYKTLAESPEFMNKSVLDLENAFYTRGTSSLEQFFWDIKEINLPDGSVMTGAQVYKFQKDGLHNAIEALLAEKEPNDTKVADLFEKTSVNTSSVASVMGQGNQESADGSHIATLNGLAVNEGRQTNMETRTVSNNPPPAEIFTLSEGHSDLYLLSRLVMRGYIPQLSDNMWKKWDGFWSGVKYILWDGGPLSNSKDSKNPLVGAWHTQKAEEFAAMTTELIKDEKKGVKEAIKKMQSTGKTQDVLTSELEDRLRKIQAIEDVLAKPPLDEKELKFAMASYVQATKTKWNDIKIKTGVDVHTVSKENTTPSTPEQAKDVIVNWKEEVQKVQANLEWISADIEAKKKEVLDALADWDKNPTDTAKKSHAMDALEAYNKYVVGVEGGVAEKFAVLGQEDIVALKAGSKPGTWLGDIVGKNFEFVEKVGKWTSETPYAKGMKRGFVWVGLMTIAWNSGEGFADLLKWGKIGTIMTRTLDLGIGAVPFVGTAHDMAILNFEDYEKWVLGAKMSPEEREMRKYMTVLGVIPGVGMGLKLGGKTIKSAGVMYAGSAVFKWGNMLRSISTYSMLGLSIVGTSYEIGSKYPD